MWGRTRHEFGTGGRGRWRGACFITYDLRGCEGGNAAHVSVAGIVGMRRRWWCGRWWGGVLVGEDRELIRR